MNTAAKRFATTTDQVTATVQTDICLPYTPDYGNDYYFSGAINGSEVLMLETTENWIAIAQIARQAPELHIDWVAAEYVDGFDDQHSASGSVFTKDTTELAPAHWEINGVETEEEMLYLQLVEMSGCGEEDAKRWDTPPVAVRMPTAAEIKLAFELGLEVVVGVHSTTIGKHIELSDWGLFHYGEAMHFDLAEAIASLRNQADTESDSSFTPLEAA